MVTASSSKYNQFSRQSEIHISAIDDRLNELRKHESNEQVMDILSRNIIAAGHGGII